MNTVISEKSAYERLFRQDLEDHIHLQMQKLHALCVNNSLLSSQQEAVSANVRLHYAMIMEEQCNELQKLLDQFFK